MIGDTSIAATIKTVTLVVKPPAAIIEAPNIERRKIEQENTSTKIRYINTNYYQSNSSMY